MLDDDAAAGVRFVNRPSAFDVRDGLIRVEELITSELTRSDDVVHHALGDASKTLGTGLRAWFTIVAAHFGPYPDAWQVTVAGAATELMHQAMLSHDEIVDETADAIGPRRTSCSNARRFNNSAIMAGDFRFAAAARLGSQLGQRGFLIVAEAFAELVAGRMRETLGAAQDADPVEHRLRCAQERYGSLVAAAGQLGATFAGVSEEVTARLSRLGRLLGTACEVADDTSIHASRSGDPHGAEQNPMRSGRDMAADAKVQADCAAQAHGELALLPHCEARQSLSKLITAMVPVRD
ncbi:polyprenyl synthetase family protein [Mycobacterium sp. ML4]